MDLSSLYILEAYYDDPEKNGVDDPENNGRCSKDFTTSTSAISGDALNKVVHA